MLDVVVAVVVAVVVVVVEVIIEVIIIAVISTAVVEKEDANIHSVKTMGLRGQSILEPRAALAQGRCKISLISVILRTKFAGLEQLNKESSFIQQDP